MSSQLQVSGEAKIRDIQGPVVANSGVITALDGAASQYVRGDGTLADFPTSSGGGSSVSYYLNSSVSQGTIGGVAYRELSKEPIIGAGTDIAISSNGYVASYLTDANDPDVVLIPGGNFNCEFYFNVNNNTGNPFFYAELYKYDGTTFTLLGSSVGVPEYITQGTTIAPYYFAIPVATATLALTDRLAIRIYVNVDGRTVTLHTENGHLCQVVTTLSKGMVSLNNLTDQSQFLTTGTSGTNFAIVSSGDTHTFNLPIASATNTGKLSSTDWSVFNSKEPAITAGTTLQYFRGDKTFQTLNTTAVVEATNLYFTDARSRAALSFTAGSGAYNSTTGVITIPTNTNQLTNGASFITLTSLSGGTGITYNNTTGVITNSAPDQTVSLTQGAGISISGTYPSFTIASTITQYTDALARAAISLTTTGTSGAATYNSTTGVFNIPNYAPDLSGYVTIGTTQTITGTKTFSEANRQESGLLLKNNVIAGLAGYTSLGGATNGLAIQLSGSSSIQTLIFQSAAAYSYTLPATSGTIALTSNISYPVTSVFGRTGAIVAVSGDYNTDLVTEGITNLYFTNARSRSAISLTVTGTSGPASYNSTTGVLNVPQYSTDLSGYVTIATTQTITGNKTFSEATRQESGLLLKNGVLAGATGYASLGGASNGLVVQLSGSANQQTLIFQSGAAYSYTLPATSGTLALTSQLTSGTVTSVGLSSATSGVTIGSSPITTSGTITLAIATASGSQNGLLSSTDWATFNGKQAALNGTGFVKISGTTISYDNSTYLTTSAASTTYLPLTGGTLTGALNGTSAVFSSIVNVNGASTLEALNVNGNMMLAGTANRYIRLQSATNYFYNLQSVNDDFQILEAGSIPRLTIKYPNGNVGIGTSSPNTIFSVVKAETLNAFTDFAQFSDNTNGLRISNYFDVGGIRWDFRRGTTSIISISQSNNVGIGTTTDSGFKLDVNGTTRTLDFTIKNSANAETLDLFLSPSTSNGFIDYPSGRSLMLRNKGSLGGLTLASTGAATFSSSVTTNNNLSVIRVGSSVTTLGQSRYLNLNDYFGNTNARMEIGLGYSAASGITNVPAIIGYLQTSTTDFTKGDIYFATRDVTTDTAPTERMRITSAGIINTTSRLNVNGAGDNSLFSLNTNGTLYTLGFSPNATASTSTTLTITTATTTWIYNGTGTATWTLPNPSGTNQMFWIKNAGTGVLTLNAFSGTNIINNSAAAVSSITIAVGATALIQQDGNVRSYQLQ
jgi:hypothetical protein